MAWDVVYYKAPDRTVPAIDFLDGCPVKVAANLLAVLDAVAESPPPQYSGGGKWEAMHGSMGGYYEVRATGPHASSSGSSAFSRTQRPMNSFAAEWARQLLQ